MIKACICDRYNEKSVTDYTRSIPWLKSCQDVTAKLGQFKLEKYCIDDIAKEKFWTDWLIEPALNIIDEEYTHDNKAHSEAMNNQLAEDRYQPTSIKAAVPFKNVFFIAANIYNDCTFDHIHNLTSNSDDAFLGDKDFVDAFVAFRKVKNDNNIRW